MTDRDINGYPRPPSARRMGPLQIDRIAIIEHFPDCIIAIILFPSISRIIFMPGIDLADLHHRMLFWLSDPVWDIFTRKINLLVQYDPSTLEPVVFSSF